MTIRRGDDGGDRPFVCVRISRRAADCALNAAIVFGGFGFFTVSCLGLLLASARSKASLDDVGVVSSGLVGAAAGATFPLAFNVLMLQSFTPLIWLPRLLPIMGILGLCGGALTAGMVAAAKNERWRELDSGGAARLLEE